MLLYRQIYVLAGGDSGHLRDHVGGIILKPLRGLTEGVGLHVGLYLFEAAAALTQGDDHARLHLEAGDVDLSAVHGEVAVVDQLAGLRAAHGEAEAVNDVVQAALADGEQVLAGLAGTALGHVEVAAELALEEAVVPLGLLLLTHLLAVLGGLAPALTVLSGGVGAVFHCALLSVAPVALEEELLALPAALAADGVCISCHFFLPPLITRGGASADGSRCAGWA